MENLHTLMTLMGMDKDLTPIPVGKFPERVQGYDLEWMEDKASKLTVKEIASIIEGKSEAYRRLINAKYGLGQLRDFLVATIDGDLSGIFYRR